MKKLVTMMLGLGLILGSVSFAQEAPKDTTKKTKAKKTKASKEKKTTEEKK